MNRPTALILRAPGINSEQETYHAFELASADPEFLHVGRLMQDPKLIEKYSIIAVPGGFAYGDDIAGLTDVSGRVLGLRPNWRRDGLEEETSSMRLFRSMVKVAQAEA